VARSRLQLVVGLALVAATLVCYGSADRFTRFVTEKVPLLALVIVASAITVHAQSQADAVVRLGALPLPARIGNALVSYAQYLEQTIWPFGLSVFYPHPYGGLPGWQVGASALLLGLITAWGFAPRLERPCLVVGWLWFLGTLVPVIGLFILAAWGAAICWPARRGRLKSASWPPCWLG
jgi:hypothetical protein